MDGFDDLLAPSRNVLEENPFEDPFAKPRAGSPDPWSRFGQHHDPQPSHSDIDYFKSAFEDEPSTAHTADSYFTSDYGHSEQTSAAPPVDPLDVAAVTAGDHEDGQSASHNDAHTDTTPSRTPGFGMFTASMEEQTETVVDPEQELPRSDKPPQAQHVDEPSTTAVSPLRTEESVSLQSPPFPQEPFSSFSSPERAVLSPLDQHSTPHIDRAFASLALGGESQGGWQTGWGTNDQVSATTSLPAPVTGADNEDDDDDTPIGQTARFRNAGSPQVRASCRDGSH
jgi:sorting nexin-1/2